MGWGLRGDPYLWRAMAKRLGAAPLPASTASLVALLEASFAEITGHSMDAEQPFRIESLAHGGMSSGGISPDFWRRIALPLLLERYGEAFG
jgi:molybdenum cofactor cytidylyltransferase